MKVFYHQGKTGGSFIRKCIEMSNARCLYIFQVADFHNAILEDYQYCYVHGQDSHKVINLLKSQIPNAALYTSIRHPISSLVSTIRHARRENNYSILPPISKMIFGSYADLSFSKLHEEVAATDGSCLNIHQYKIHGAGTYLTSFSKVNQAQNFYSAIHMVYP